MIRLSQITMPVGHTREALVQKCCKALKIAAGDMKEFRIVKQSVDARKMPDIIYSYVVDISCDKESKVLAKSRLRQAELIEKHVYRFPKSGEVPLKKPIVIIGMGPAGLFCGYMLAKHGYKPIILERGQDVEARTKKVTRFWETGVLDTRSNVQFGEGGAGTFSDGKLNTLVKDKSGRNLEVLSILVENGAPEHILYDAKPHIGTDVLSRIVKRMREKILAWGGEVRFESQVTDFRIENDQLIGGQLENGDEIMCAGAVLAIGHSARD
ncbi:MAG: FAD-dependent oxidoreductase, partial [Lachnospiraceae bacterium]|nr:FAD-dependent oxidoreductase [Lachnospiraceae bacterium]